MNYFKKIIVAATLLFSFLAFSQLQSGFYFGKRPLSKADIVMEDGTHREGYLKSFLMPKFFETGMGAFKTLEKSLHLDTKEFKFQKTKTSPVEIININDVKTIYLINEQDKLDVIQFDKMKLKTVNSKMEVVDLDRTVILPLQSDGKLKIYGFSITMMEGKQYMGSFLISYIRTGNDKYAYIPFDINRFNLFNIGKAKGKFQVAFQEATKKCPAFQTYLKENEIKITREKRKELIKEFKEKEKRKKEARKSVKGKDMKNFVQYKIDHEYNIKGYIEIQEKYNELCNE